MKNIFEKIQKVEAKLAKFNRNHAADGRFGSGGSGSGGGAGGAGGEVSSTKLSHSKSSRSSAGTLTVSASETKNGKGGGSIHLTANHSSGGFADMGTFKYKGEGGRPKAVQASNKKQAKAIKDWESHGAGVPGLGVGGISSGAKFKTFANRNK